MTNGAQHDLVVTRVFDVPIKRVWSSASIKLAASLTEA
jgi:hypothetical protein